MSRARVEDQDLGGNCVWAHAHEHYNKLHGPASGQIINAFDLPATPDGARITFTAIFRHNFQYVPTTRICSVYVNLRSHETSTRSANNNRLPQWLKNGQQLAFLFDRYTEGTFELFSRIFLTPTRHRKLSTMYRSQLKREIEAYTQESMSRGQPPQSSCI